MEKNWKTLGSIQSRLHVAAASYALVDTRVLGMELANVRARATQALCPALIESSAHLHHAGASAPEYAGPPNLLSGPDDAWHLLLSIYIYICIDCT